MIFTRFLGIPVGEQLHRALEIGEQDGHLLPLAFECRLRGEDSLGEMFRRVRLGRHGRRPDGRSRGHDLLAAFQAELRGPRSSVPQLGHSTTRRVYAL
jgi:hypothetical protein